MIEDDIGFVYLNAILLYRFDSWMREHINQF